MSEAPISRNVLDHFSALEDPREGWRVLYPLPEILLLVLCGTLAGMEDFVEIVLWGKERLDFLRRFLPFERGIPSHDALNDVLNALDAELFRSCFTSWVDTLRDTDPELIAIDGKTQETQRGPNPFTRQCARVCCAMDRMSAVSAGEQRRSGRGVLCSGS